jgi:hypothetical protein
MRDPQKQSIEAHQRVQALLADHPTYNLRYANSILLATDCSAMSTNIQST